MHAPWRFRAGDKKRVVIIGAGIAGMTAAHELVERGYEVEVIEVEKDPYSPDAAPDPAIGGMARTSWATVPTPSEQFPLAQRRDPFTRLDPDRGPAPTIATGDRILEMASRFAKSCQESGSPLAVTVFGPRDHEMVFKLDHWLAKAGIVYAWTFVPQKIDVAAPASGPTPPLKIQFAIQSARVPGEHGFRFFPSFYRHMFETMKRIPIAEASIAGSPLADVELTSDSSRTVFDALHSADEMELGLVDGDAGPRSYKIERRPMRSLEQIRDLLANVLEKAGYRGADLYRLATRYLEYLTSSAERRSVECEGMSWAKFLGLGKLYSAYFVEHVNSGAQALVAMTSEKNDARTVGSIAVQLTLDQIRANPSGYTDATLRGPTSLSLFGPWRAYLESQQVKFTWGELVGFTGEGMAVRPVFARRGEGFRDAWLDVEPADYYVITIPVDRFQALFKVGGAPATKLRRARPLLSRKELVAANALCLELDALQRPRPDISPVDRDDLDKYLTFTINDFEAHPDTGPFRYMCGIQFYFKSDVRVFLGHSVGLDSPWGVSYLSQEQYWQSRARGQSGSRGVLSAIFTRFEVPALGRPGSKRLTAKQCSADEIAERVWKQIGDTWDAQRNGPLPMPQYYFLDENLKPVGGRWQNRTPYLVNHVGQWDARGGARLPDGDYAYPVQLGHTVFAGAFMRTKTRLNTMEAANESGRRAVNAILDHDQAQCQRVPVYDLEDFEVPALRTARALDARIFKRGGAHVLRHTGVELALRGTPWDLVRLGLLADRGPR